MMAHIEKVDDGKYKAVVEIGIQGKRKRRTRTLDTYKEAENWMANMIRDKEEGQMLLSSEKCTTLPIELCTT